MAGVGPQRHKSHYDFLLVIGEQLGWILTNVCVAVPCKILPNRLMFHEVWFIVRGTFHC